MANYTTASPIIQQININLLVGKWGKGQRWGGSVLISEFI